jgi:predicted nucleotidyltransferase
MDLYQLLKENKERIEAIAKGYGVYHIRIFGSVARHEADEKSDIDLLIDLEPSRGLLDLSGFLVDVEELLDTLWMQSPKKDLSLASASRSCERLGLYEILLLYC